MKAIVALYEQAIGKEDAEKHYPTLWSSCRIKLRSAVGPNLSEGSDEQFKSIVAAQAVQWSTGEIKDFNDIMEVANRKLKERLRAADRGEYIP